MRLILHVENLILNLKVVFFPHPICNFIFATVVIFISFFGKFDLESNYVSYTGIATTNNIQRMGRMAIQCSKNNSFYSHTLEKLISIAPFPNQNFKLFIPRRTHNLNLYHINSDFWEMIIYFVFVFLLCCWARSFCFCTSYFVFNSLF